MNHQMDQEIISSRADRYVDNSVSDLQQANRQPIGGYEDQNIVTLEVATEKILSFINNNRNYITTAKQECIRDSNLLTLDESAAIYLYTMSTPLFTSLNTALRAENREAVKPWFAFLKLFMSGLKKLPSSMDVVWRSVSADVGAFPVRDDVKIWWGVNSFTTELKVAESYLGERGIVFAMEPIYGKKISEYSAFPQENEVILMPGTAVRVKSGPCNFKNLLLLVHLKEEITIQQNIQYGRSIHSLKDDVISGKTPIRGVNLGGWLVIDHWMTSTSPAWNGVPDDIANQGEYQTMKYLGHAKGDDQFKQHRDNYITEQDFREIAAAKLNTVRIPVGYWITGFDKSGGGDPNAWAVFAPGGINYLDQVIRQWAPNNNIFVFLSFHAAKGSQNGNGHSAPADPEKSHWSAYPENVINTLDAVEWLARRYKDDVSFLGIGLLNEPTATTDEGVLKQYYYDAYKRIRAFSDCLLMIAPLLYHQGPYDSDWNRFMPSTNFHNMRHDWHRYHIWGFEDWDKQRILSYAENDLKTGIQQWTGTWLIIGEWCLKAAADFTDDELHRFAQAQLSAFNLAVGGWTFWTWKFYSDDGSRNEWSLRSMVNRGFIKL